MQYLLVSTLDKACREFLANNDTSALQVVDWYAEDVSHIIKLGLSPSSFPALGTELPQTGGLEAKWILVSDFDSLAAANKVVDDLSLEREKAGAELPPIPPKPDYLGFLTALMSDLSLPLECQPFYTSWRLFPDDLINDQKRWFFWQKMTGNPTYFVTPEVIATIQAYAETYHVSLVPPPQ